MEDGERWPLLNIGRGDCVEIELKHTDWDPPSEATAGFLVMSRFVTGDGGMGLVAHSVGCTDPSLNKELSSIFNRKEGCIHLCISTPCTEAEEGYLHSTRVRVYTREGFNPSYFTASHRRQVSKWLGEVPAGSNLEESEEEVEDPGLDTGRGGASSQPLSKEGAVEGRKAVLKTPKRASRPSALRSAPAAALRARGKGVSGGDKPSEDGPFEDRLNAGPADRAFSDFPSDVHRRVEAEVGHCSKSTWGPGSTLHQGFEENSRGGRWRGTLAGRRQRFRLCGGVEEPDEWSQSEKEESGCGYKRFFFERHLDAATPTSSAEVRGAHRAHEVHAASRFVMEHPPPWCPQIRIQASRSAPFHFSKF